ERGRVRALRHGDVDGAPAVHERVARHDVRAVGDLRNVAEKYGGEGARSNRYGLEVLDVLDDRVQRHHRVTTVDLHVAGRADQVRPGNCAHYLVGRHVVGAEA